MRKFFQSGEYDALFNHCRNSFSHRIKFSINGVSDYIVAIQHKQNKAGLFQNPVIIDGLCLPPGSKTRKIQFLHRVVSGLKSYSFLPFSCLQIRNSEELKAYQSILEGQGFSFRDHLSYLNPIRKEEFCWCQLAPTRKKQILKSLDLGAKIVEASRESEIKELYNILAGLYRVKIKQQFPEFRLFSNFWQLSRKSERAKIFLVKYQEETVAGIICPVDPKERIYEWYVCGQDKEYPMIHPSVLATWAPIQYAANHHIPLFDFMGAGHPDQFYGVRNFKKKFGGEMINIGKFVYYNEL